MSVQISVIIPTYHDWKRLAMCVDALVCQTFPKNNFEVIIVNNDPNDSIPLELILPDNMIIINESKPGSYAARNSAMKIAKGNILAFTDSDCIPDKDWLNNAYKYFKNNISDRVGGKIDLFYLADKKTMAECYEAAYAFRQKRNVNQKKVSVTANLFVNRKVFQLIGVFDEVMSGGDIDWNRRASLQNVSIVYGEDVIINHPARDSLEELKRKKIRVFQGIKKIQKQSFKDHLKNVFYPFLLFYIFVITDNKPIFDAKELNFFDKMRAFVVKFLIFKWVSLFYIDLLIKEYFKK
ncbi:glycosyltransferase [Cyclobacterium marinum]|uniref:Glycosyl transferase family 2 n=1 Tax=Cyclobacterium marinum (strain ATCC 25205 / DSM 745 / LMG 13164 / NCIMB 1802) TaxID=880070 RepID=G0J665_CYCMS|nr:glycosyltransferase [Cyclobacterium marinum]AEL26817.1 glycosyl transferase family 2 [Cyclobacterium marinum DSM 745]